MKTKAIMVVLVGFFGLLCVGFGVSVTQKYRLQKERVHTLERQLAAGRTEVLKVPELMENLEKVEVAKKEVEGKFTTCSSEKDGLSAKAAELQKEVDTFGAIKVAVGVQIGGLQNTIMEQQNKLNELESQRSKLSEQISTLEGESKGINEKFEMQIADIKRSEEEIKKQLIYYTEAKKVADQEIAEKQKLIAELQQELARLKSQGQPGAPGVPSTPPSSGSSSEPHFPIMESGKASQGPMPGQKSWDLPATEELDKTFALLRERITSPSMSLTEVSILLSRAEKALKNLK
jgi:hypothetical protein